MRSKRYKKLSENLKENNLDTLEKLLPLIKKNCTSKFDEAIDLSFQINNKQKKSEINLRTVVNMPGGTGKKVKVAVVCEDGKAKEAKDSGADIVGGDDLIEKIKGGYLDFEKLICTPAMMIKLSKLGKVLGPKGLMPNPKTGTVTMDVKKAISDIKGGKIDFKVDKTGIIHASIGKASFSADKIFENADELIRTIEKIKPSTSKGTYIKSIFMSSTMSQGISIDTKLA